MFVLRKYFGNGIENNFALGNSYQYINKETNSLEFESCMIDSLGEDVDEECCGFIVGEDVKNIIPLWKVQKNYIMMDNGKTFANLTFK